MSEQFYEKIIWQDIPIKISCIFEWPINTFCHIEIRANQRLPITETSYRSHFMLLEELNGYDSHVDYVTAWLDHTAKSKEWKQHVEQSRQDSLFDL